jgi:hypothetical protein
MTTYAERKAETERLTAMLPAVRDELLRIPGVTRVTVGVRERGGSLTGEIVFRVHVVEKLPLSALPRDRVVPPSIRGVPIDVVVQRKPTPETGFSDEDDWKEYSPRVGGSRIGAEVAGGTGTLGCFCKRTTDNKIVLLSNWHVLIDPGGNVGDGVGHPQWKKSCCCVCGRIGTVLAFDKPLDCAIAEIEPKISYAAKVRRIRQADGTVEQEGTILGSAPPVAGDEVYKVGARTGLTRGIISDTDANRVEITPNAPFTRMSNKGDSGSVYISLPTGMVCGLHHSGDGTLAFGTPFPAVAAALNIDVIASTPDLEYTVSDWLETDQRPLAEPPFDALAERLRLTPAGQELLRLMHAHREEALTLVNQRRRFTVAWQRFQGPAFLAAFARSAQDPLYRIPQQIQGVTRHDAAHHIAEALRLTASPELRADLDAGGPALSAAFLERDTLADMLQTWEDARPLAMR